MPFELPDPRSFSPVADARFAALFARAARSLGASGVEAASAEDRAVEQGIAALFDDLTGASLAALFDAAPSVALYRYLWRRVSDLMGRPASRDGEQLAVALFAIPVVVVAGRETGDGPTQLPAALSDVTALADILREHDATALAGHRTIALANVLVDANALDLAQWPRLRRAATDALASREMPLAFAPSPVAVAQEESVHLRFIAGSALAAHDSTGFNGDTSGTWTMPFARALGAQLAAPGATVLALPRAPAALPQAFAAGKVAQREVAAQVFASNALRRMRASVGEPVAVVSAHRLDDGGGELRLSLSSPFSPRDAEGFRCPLFAFEPVADAAQMLDALLRDCRVTDVRVEPGIHADRDGGTGLPLLFKPTSNGPRIAWPQPR